MNIQWYKAKMEDPETTIVDYLRYWNLIKEDERMHRVIQVNGYNRTNKFIVGNV